ncbi:hypothetical protein OUZ56_010443 [Daphnia magna]|uniref:Major facilitator superfamily (MFS) profile domain-containing protein n=1 Tax=Daphnia magna TaxID=35525 RepID=A0ABR0AIJ6_9CRUS|nr:hypothetical protein OUZ56_010443 [Daphnia magna]
MIVGCDHWIYDTSLFQSTIVTEFDLTCENEWKETLASSVYMFGMLIGAATLGNIADRIGRKLAFSVNVVLLATLTTGLAFSPNFITFCVLRFLCGITAIGHFLILFVWGVEAVGKKYRVMCGFIYQCVFTVGCAVLGLVAFYIRDWKNLQLVISVPMFALVSLYWVVPESIRWLIAKKRYSEARLLILQAAKMNKKNVPDHLIFVEKEKSDDTGGRDHEGEPVSGSVSKGESIQDVFHFQSSIEEICDHVLGLDCCRDGLTDFLSFQLITHRAVEIPAYISGIFLVDKLGRKPTLSGGLIASGVACLITGLVPEDPPAIRITFSMLGKLFISCVMATVYSYTSDLFPTSARSAAVGLCSTFGRVGGILAPIIATAGRKIDPALPFIVFAGVNLSVGLLCLLLPETNKTTLPDTVEEAEEMEK